MTIEADIYGALQGLVANRVYPDLAPAGVARPYVTFQQVGGEAINYLERVPVGKRNARFQVNCWADSRSVAADLSRRIEDAMVLTLRAGVLSAPVAIYDEETSLYGTRSDFDLWF